MAPIQLIFTTPDASSDSPSDKFVFGVLALFPLLLSVASNDFSNVHRLAIDRPLLRAAMVLAIARPLPMWRAAPSSTEAIEPLLTDIVEQKEGSRLLCFLAQRNSQANRLINETAGQVLRERGYQSSKLGWRSLIGNIIVFLAAYVLAIWGSLYFSSEGRKMDHLGFSIGILTCQAFTGLFSVLDRELRETSGARSAHKGRLYHKYDRDYNEYQLSWGNPFRWLTKQRLRLSRWFLSSYADSARTTVTYTIVPDFHLKVKVSIASLTESVKIPLRRLETIDVPDLILKNTEEPQTQNVWEKKYILSFKRYCWFVTFLRWSRLEWGLVCAQLVLWAQLTKDNDWNVFYCVGAAQILPAFVGACIIFCDVMGEANRNDRILATVRMNDPVYPHIAYTLGNRFVQAAWKLVADLHECWHNHQCPLPEAGCRQKVLIPMKKLKREGRVESHRLAGDLSTASGSAASGLTGATASSSRTLFEDAKHQNKSSAISVDQELINTAEAWDGFLKEENGLQKLTQEERVLGDVFSEWAWAHMYKCGSCSGFCYVRGRVQEAQGAVELPVKRPR